MSTNNRQKCPRWWLKWKASGAISTGQPIVDYWLRLAAQAQLEGRSPAWANEKAMYCKEILDSELWPTLAWSLTLNKGKENLPSTAAFRIDDQETAHMFFNEYVQYLVWKTRRSEVAMRMIAKDNISYFLTHDGRPVPTMWQEIFS